MTVGKLFMDNLNYFDLYALYAKNKPKSDQLMRDFGQKFFGSVQVNWRFSARFSDIIRLY